MTERVYVELFPERVHPELRRRARLAVDHAAILLGLRSVPAVQWVLPAEACPTGWGGDEHRVPATWQAFCHSDTPDRVYLRGDRLKTVVVDALHESYHLHQLAAGEWSDQSVGHAPSNYDALEIAANQWAHAALRYPLTRG